MKTLNILVVTMLLMTALVGIGTALVPPPPPPPPVPQNIGLYDTSIISLVTNATDQSACRVCHQATGTNLSGVLNGSTYNNSAGTVPSRHHSLLPRQVINPNTSVPFACQDCHPSTPGVGMGILLDRSCLDCHNGTNTFYGDALGGHVGNITRPHHVNTSYASSNIGNPAQNRSCNFCHGSVVDNYNDQHYKPSYATDFMITPYASFKVTNFSQPANGEIPPDSDDNKTWGGCYSCHEDVPNAVPSPIGSNHDNHHNSINGLRNGPGMTGVSTPGETCSWCHVILPPSTSPYRFNITNPFTGELLVRAMEVRNSTIEAMDIANSSFELGTTNITINGTGCEKCHDVKSIHNIQFNYQSGGNGPQGLGHINNNVDCYGCHNSWLPADTWVPGALVPTVTTINPSAIVANTPMTVTFTGLNFKNDPYTSVVAVDGVTYTPTSVTDTQIIVDIPALAEGIHTTQVIKGGDTLSNLETLTVAPGVTLSSASLSGTTLTLSGSGLGSQPATNAKQYVIVGSTGYSASVVSWTDTQIVATVSGTVNAGDTVEVITADGGQATATVTISAPKLTTITVVPSPASVKLQKTLTFTATAKDQNGAVMKGVVITWSSSVTTIGTVSPSSGTTGTNGQVTTIFTAKKKGTTTVTAKSGNVSGTSAVTVN